MGEKTERCEWKDITSAAVIFLIWVEHLGNYNVGPIRDFVTLYANPVFFMIAGFFADRASRYTFKNFFIKNVRRLLIPYVVWGGVNIAYWCLYKNVHTLEVVKEGVWQYVKCDIPYFKYGGTAWFLVGIFIAKMLYEILRRIFKNKYLVCVISFIIMLGMIVLQVKGYPVLNYGYTRGIYWLFFYSLGPIFFKLFNDIKNSIDTKWKNQKRKAVCYHIIMCVMTGLMIYIYFYGVDICYQNLGAYTLQIAIQIIIPLLMTVFTIIATLYIKVGNYILAEIGRNTIVLCNTESMFKSLIPTLFSAVGISFAPQNCLSCMIYVAVCFGLSYKWLIPVINKYAPFMLGVSDKNNKSNYER